MGLIKNIYKIKEQVYLLVQKFQKKENLINNELLESSLNRFFLICNLTSDLELLKIEDIYRKCVFCYYDNKFNISICNSMLDS